jgi:hypothetical protein
MGPSTASLLRRSGSTALRLASARLRNSLRPTLRRRSFKQSSPSLQGLPLLAKSRFPRPRDSRQRPCLAHG